MKSNEAVVRLSALAQTTRLAVFRRLMSAGQQGVAAGQLAQELAVPPSTMSVHLSILEQAGLVSSTRLHRNMFYAANITSIRALIDFLMVDCYVGSLEFSGIDNVTGIRIEDSEMTDPVYNVLFICTGNSARSIMAEAILNKLGNGRFRAFSAGSQPAGEVNPFALGLLQSLGFPTGGLRSKSWDEFSGPDAPKMDFVFTVCDNAASEVCPIWPGHPMTAHWGFEDPSAFTGNETEKKALFWLVLGQIRRRIEIFTNLPIASLEKLALQARLTEIGTQPA